MLWRCTSWVYFAFPRNGDQMGSVPLANTSDLCRKLVIIGDGACGKTSLLSVFTLGYFPTVSQYLRHTSSADKLTQVLCDSITFVNTSHTYLRPLKRQVNV
jgi:GTPase SAR1 family protein